jgi:hypothetical protein
MAFLLHLRLVPAITKIELFFYFFTSLILYQKE